MKSHFLTATILSVSLLIGGCAAPVVKYELANPERSSSVVVSDLRPASERQSENFSLLITSSAYGISRRGEEEINPPAIQILRHKAFEKFGSTRPLQIKVHHFVSYLNMKSELRSGAIGAGVGGILGAVIGSAVANSSSVNLSQTVVVRSQFDAKAQEEHERAFYTKEENPENASVYVIYLDAEINNKRVFVKTLTPTKPPEGKNAYALAIESTIGFYLSKY